MYEFEPTYEGYYPDEPVVSGVGEEGEELNKKIERLSKELESLRLKLDEKSKKEVRLKDRLRKLEEENRSLMNLVNGDSVSGCKNCMRLEKEIENLKERLVVVETERYIEFLQERVSTQGDSFSYLRENVWVMLEELREGKLKLEDEMKDMARRVKLYKSLLMVSSVSLIVLIFIVLFIALYPF